MRGAATGGKAAGIVESPYDSGEALFAFDAELRLVVWNEEAERLTGFSAGEALGRHCWEILDGVDNEGQRVCRPDCSYARMMMRGEAPRGPVVQIRTKGGARRKVGFSLLTVQGGEHAQYLHLVHPEARQPAESSRVGDAELTPRQVEVLELAADGLSGREIGAALGLAETTVRNHLKLLQFKLDCTSRDELTVKARALGLLEARTPATR
jgi:PAS domain S-box-containing protein